ncbi:MAG: hypothetical protein SFT92_10165 [Rickettsiales bacterium]|nr:hypothetical protein [Rickettsiales bacterium]
MTRILTIALVSITMLVMALVLTWWRESSTILNADNAWLLYAAQRYAAGEALYIDFFEVNPPLIIYLNLLPVWLAQLTSMEVITAFRLSITLFILLSLALSYQVIRKHPLCAKPSAALMLFGYAVAGLLLAPVAVYGEREHLWIAFVFPYLLFSGAIGPLFSRCLRICVALLAAIGFALKPFFLLLWVANEAVTAYQNRSLRSVGALHNRIIVAGQLFYWLAIYVTTPAYITTVLPLAWHSYFAFNDPMAVVLSYVGPAFALALGLAALAWIQGAYQPLITRLLVLLCASVAINLVQHKAWINHLYPTMFFTIWVVVALFMALWQEWKQHRLNMKRRQFITLWLVGVTLWYSVHSLVLFTQGEMNRTHRLQDQIVQAIDKYAKNDYVYPLTFSLMPGFPAINYSNGLFRGSQHHLWVYAGWLVRDKEVIQAQRSPAPWMTQARQFVLDQLVQDFMSHPPALVWVDRPDNYKGSRLYNMNIIADLTQDPRFAKLWKSYRLIGQVVSEDAPASYDLYARVKP